MWKTTFYLYTVKRAIDGKNFVSGGTKMIVENEKLKDLKLEKPLENIDLNNDCNRCSFLNEQRELK
jgi:hypothetical protein